MGLLLIICVLKTFTRNALRFNSHGGVKTGIMICLINKFECNLDMVLSPGRTTEGLVLWRGLHVTCNQLLEKNNWL